MKSRRPAIFRFVLQAHAVAVSGMSDSEAGKWFRALLRDLESGNPSSDVAREMIEHQKKIVSLCREHGLASARVRAANPEDPNVVSAPFPVRPTSPDSVPAKEVFMAHAAVIGLPDAEAESCWKFWTGAGWMEKSGKPVQNWKYKLSSWRSDFLQKRSLSRSASSRNASTANVPEKATYAPDDPLFGEQALAAAAEKAK